MQIPASTPQFHKHFVLPRDASLHVVKSIVSLYDVSGFKGKFAQEATWLKPLSKLFRVGAVSF